MLQLRLGKRSESLKDLEGYMKVCIFSLKKWKSYLGVLI